MAVQVISPDQVKLNDKFYKIKGPVTGGWLDPFPEQISIGDPSYANRRDLSSWVITSPLYIGVEEMEERVDANRCWWTNCITKYRNHILPPRLATALTAPTANPTAPTIVNADMELTTGWTGGARSSSVAHGGTYSWILNGADTTAYQDVTGYVPGCAYTLKIWAYTAAASQTRIGIDDGVTTTYSSYHSGVEGWEQLTVTKTLSVAATRMRISMDDSNTASASNFDDATITSDTTMTVGNPVLAANFNSNLYYLYGRVLAKLNSGRTAFTAVAYFATAPTAIIPSLNSRLYIYMGDSTNYWYMSTAEAFTQSNSANANWGKQFDAKLFKMNTSGTVAYSTDPDGATPTWTSGGSITDIADQIEGFVVGRDASGTITLYAPTNSILKAYDSATPQWVDTEVVLPNHPIGGEGAEYWNDEIWLSYGLAVRGNRPETGAIDEIGLTERDGLPIEYNGEITCLRSGGSEGMFAAVDASVTSGNSKSGLYLYDGFGWQCWWVDASNDGAMNDIIVSPAESAYAVYWDAGGIIYYIDIPRGVQNPDKITQSYATAGIFLSPWFDAGNGAAAKLAKFLETFAKGVTATETVALKYRIDHTNTDLDTGWTTMDTLNTTGEAGTNKELFASRAGSSIKAIQFRLDFVTGGSTAKADIQNMVFYYRKRTGAEKKRFWNVTIVCTDDAQDKAKQKVANLKTAIESATDVLFYYHRNDNSDEGYYVEVNCPEFNEQTGGDYSGEYKLTLIEA